MTDRAGFTRAVAALSDSTPTDADLCSPFLWALTISGAAVSTFGDPLGTQTICASNRLAARIDEIQADLGEGPAWQARETGRLATEPDLQGGRGEAWPLARIALRETGVGALHAFPLAVGTLRLGSVDLYTDLPSRLTPLEIDDATALAELTARQVLRRAFLDIATGGPEMPAGEYSRREVHQAAGMIAAQLRIGVEDALLVLHAHAFGSGRSLREAAAEVVERRVDFTPGTPGAPDSPN